MKILTASQFKELDKYTIEHEPVASVDLMERAAKAIVTDLEQRWKTTTRFIIFAGPGNNGGDALAVARMLCQDGYPTQTFLFNITGRLSNDCLENKKRLEKLSRANFTEISSQFSFPETGENDVIIDGLFGTGLNKPLDGGYAGLVKRINTCRAKVVSIDVPSGLMAEDNSHNNPAAIVCADLTLTIFFEPAISLPDDLPFTYTASYEKCLHIANFLKTHYAKLIGMDDPQTMISGGDRFIDGSQHYQIALYEKGSTDSDTLLNQQFRSASFHCDDEGKLWIIRIHAPDLSQHCGDYPIISVQEAEALLKEGTYLSNVPYDIGGESQIAKVDLVYRHGQFDRYFMPYYRFLIDIGKDGDMRQYGAFYVPAVASEYIETAG